MLEVADLHVRRGATHVLKGVSLDVADGEIVTLIGPNGAGKTTLLMTISGLLPVHSGAISCRIGGAMRALSGLPPSASWLPASYNVQKGARCSLR
jgi:ABC-type branched-subunit amino acid transport system ATPase component